MNIELTDLEEILLYLATTSLEPHNDYTSEFTYKDQKILYKYIKELQQENEKLKDNWNELKEYISIKLYNTEYLQKLCGCRIDDIDHILLDVIREEMQEIEREGK
jgi:hypothetical protein